MGEKFKIYRYTLVVLISLQITSHFVDQGIRKFQVTHLPSPTTYTTTSGKISSASVFCLFVLFSFQ